MANTRAFLVVGHRHWGKSTTLRALTNHQRGWVMLDGKRFFVRLMSNDDVPDSYEDFINGLDPAKKPFIIAAYCPENLPYPLITALAKKYNVFLWVLEHNYHDTAAVAASEIEALRKFGKVECYAQRGTEAASRGAALAQFVKANVG